MARGNSFQPNLTSQLAAREFIKRLRSKDMRFPRGFSLVATVLLAALAACTSKQDPQELKEKTARATAELKVDAKAVAAGIREGWSRDKPLDVNSATREQLITLPGVSEARMRTKSIAGVLTTLRTSWSRVTS
jgi:DNA uptake protein ComE-like DNA-binding protein